MICLKRNFKALDKIKDGAAFLAGAVLYACSVNCFTAPNDIAPGGVTGLATAIHSLTGFPIGTVSLIINIPLLILAILFIGGMFTAKTVTVTVLVSFAIDALNFLPVYRGEKLLCCILGGLLSGAAIGIVFLRGGTTGGTDIVARLLRRKWKNVSAGRMILLADSVVIAFAGVVYRSIESAIYAVVVIFVSTVVIDRIVYGGDGGKCFLIMSEKNGDIAKHISGELRRGVTFLDGSGFYSRRPAQVILCSVRRNEAAALRNIIRRVDPDAFAVACDAADILGQGFRPWDRDDQV